MYEVVNKEFGSNVADLTEKQCMTNVDKIRSMSDEQLADEMLKFPEVCEQIPFCHNEELCGDILERGELLPEGMCKRCLMNWLKKEIKE